MMQRLAVACCLLTLALAVSAAALEVEVGGLALVGPFANTNALLEQFEAEAGEALPELSFAGGCDLRLPLLRLSDRSRAGAGVRILGAGISKRDTNVAAMSIGAYAWGDYRFGPWNARADLGLCRGSFNFAAGRYVGLSGWGFGAAGEVVYWLPIGRFFAVGAAIGVQWLPIPQMADSGGRIYRGRGTPFVDFSGISFSIRVRRGEEGGDRG